MNEDIQKKPKQLNRLKDSPYTHWAIIHRGKLIHQQIPQVNRKRNLVLTIYYFLCSVYLVNYST